MHRPCLNPAVASLASIAALASTSLAQSPPPGRDFDWATITHPGNLSFPGNLNNPKWQGTWEGRGRVDYTYRIAKGEVSTAQWTEFVNTFSTQSGFPTFLWGRHSFAEAWGVWWGADPDPTYQGPGTRWVYGDRGDWPVQQISWRDAALYCNWLHNGKSSDPSSLWDGAYDTSTWSTVGIGNWTVTDAVEHRPDARFWMPTLDEWMKAVFYDPNRYGAGHEGWWKYVNSSDSPPVPGLPGEPGATTSGGLPFNYPEPWGIISVPLGAYAGQVSPWGLLDTGSGASEWLQDPVWSVVSPGRLLARRIGGSYAGDFAYLDNSQAGWFENYYVWDFGLGTGARLASAIPAPATLVILVSWGVLLARPTRSGRR